MDGVRAFKLAQLSELRLVSQEVGGLSEARSMPTEIRKWWVEQMLKKDQGNDRGPVEQGGKRFVTKDVK